MEELIFLIITFKALSDTCSLHRNKPTAVHSQS